MAHGAWKCRSIETWNFGTADVGRPPCGTGSISERCVSVANGMMPEKKQEDAKAQPLKLLAQTMLVEADCRLCRYQVTARSERALQAALADHYEQTHGSP
jgi:hypothetical protein